MVLMIYAALVVLGLCFGSFANALVWRLHEQEKLAGKKKADKKYVDRLSIRHGRSMCPHCHHELAVKDLVPVLSWLWLKGKCRYCGRPISPQYPLVELATAGLFVASYLWWPTALQPTATSLWPNVLFGLWIIMLVGFIALIVYDLRWYLLPNRIIYPLTGLALTWAVISLLTTDRTVVGLSKAVLAVAIGGGLFYVLFQVSKGKWIGGGDVRLGWLLGLVVLTPARAILMIFLASLLGTAVSLPLLAIKRLQKNSVVPFGPFLILATFIVQLFGISLLTWYKRTFLML